MTASKLIRAAGAAALLVSLAACEEEDIGAAVEGMVNQELRDVTNAAVDKYTFEGNVESGLLADLRAELNGTSVTLVNGLGFEVTQTITRVTSVDVDVGNDSAYITLDPFLQFENSSYITWVFSWEYAWECDGSVSFECSTDGSLTRSFETTFTDITATASGGGWIQLRKSDGYVSHEVNIADLEIDYLWVVGWLRDLPGLTGSEATALLEEHLIERMITRAFRSAANHIEDVWGAGY